MIALGSAAGLTWGQRNLDIDGVDIAFKYPGRMPQTGKRYPQLDVQVKTDSNPMIRDGFIHHSLPRKNYQDLQGEPGVDFTARRVLFVVVTPRVDQGLTGSGGDHFVFHRSAYWLNLMNAPSIPDAQGNKTVYVPLKNRLNVQTLLNLMGLDLPYARLEEG